MRFGRCPDHADGRHRVVPSFDKDVATCSCGASITGVEWAIQQHQRRSSIMENTPQGNVPGTEGYDPTVEQDVEQQDVSTPRHTETGQTAAYRETGEVPAQLVDTEPNVERVASGAVSEPYEIASLIVTRDVNPTETVVVSEGFAKEYGVPAGSVAYGELETLLASKGTQLVAQAQAPASEDQATVAAVAGDGEDGDVDPSTITDGPVEDPEHAEGERN